MPVNENRACLNNRVLTWDSNHIVTRRSISDALLPRATWHSHCHCHMYVFMYVVVVNTLSRVAHCHWLASREWVCELFHGRIRSVLFVGLVARGRVASAGLGCGRSRSAHLQQRLCVAGDRPTLRSWNFSYSGLPMFHSFRLGLMGPPIYSDGRFTTVRHRYGQNRASATT